MRIFQTVQRYLASIGYVANGHPFNIHTVGVIFQTILMTICLFMYLIRDANTSKEVVDNNLLTSTVILFIVCRMSTAHKMKSIFILIDDFEQFVNASEFNTQCEKYENTYICRKLIISFSFQ